MLPVISNQTEVMLEKGYKSLTRLGPAPGHWFTTLASDKECDQGLGAEELVVAARAEYIIQDSLINIVPSFHNYQDIRTLFSVATTQTFRYRFKNECLTQESNMYVCRNRQIHTSTRLL